MLVWVSLAVLLCSDAGAAISKDFVLCFKRKMFRSGFDCLSVFFFRMASLQDVPRAHQREYEKHVENIDSSKITAQEWEKPSGAAMSYRFYRGMKTYVENLVNCFNEKVCDFSFPSLPPISLRWWTCILSRQKWDFLFGNDDERWPVMSQFYQKLECHRKQRRNRPPLTVT